ncbi:MAG: DUF819 family protein [Anaerovoracaceae bacterium]
MNIAIALLFFLFPMLVIAVCNKFPLVDKLGIVIVCYLSGVLVGNIGILPESFAGMQTTLSEVTVVIALPLLLFSVDIRSWTKLAGKSILSMLLAVVAIIIVVTILQLTIGKNSENAWQLGGMAVALYTGGTPNLAAIKVALDISENTFILFNTYDLAFSFLYILILTTAPRFIFQKIFRLKSFEATADTLHLESNEEDGISERFKSFPEKREFAGIGIAFLISAAIVGLGLVISGILPKDMATGATIFTITTLGIAASFIGRVRDIKFTFQSGMYIIYVFCFTVATMTTMDAFKHIDFTLLIYVTISIFGSLIIHAILCKIFKIDADTMIITSVSAICSPPFVPVVAGVLKNKFALISGLVTGIIGYAVGNYLGILIGNIFKSLL